MKLFDCAEFNVLRRHQDNLFRFMTITAGADDLVVNFTQVVPFCPEVCVEATWHMGR